MQPEVLFKNIKHHILTELRKATEVVILAVAWFTDDELFNVLIELSSKGIQVQLLLNQDEINENSGLDYPTLFRNGGMVYFVNAREVLMHNKFCVIDNNTVLNGSYNWTRKASSNLENLTIIHDSNISQKFIQEFNSLKEKAKAYFEEIDFNHPKFVSICNEEINYEALIERANKRKDNENYLASLLDLKKAIEISPEKETELLFEIAYCQSELKDNENALSNYSKYLQFNETSTAAINNRGLLYEKTNKLKKAYEDFSRAIKLQPTEPLYYRNRADLSKSFTFWYKQDSHMPVHLHIPFDKTHLEEYVQISEFNNEQHFRSKFNLQEKIKRGIEDYLKVLELDPDCSKWDIYFSIAEMYYDLRNYAQSIEYYTKVIKMKPNDDYSYYSRGWSYYMINKFDKAISDIEKALLIKPNSNSYKEAIKKIKKESRKIKYWFK